MFSLTPIQAIHSFLIKKDPWISCSFPDRRIFWLSFEGEWLHLALPAVALGVVAGPTFLAPKNGGHGTHGTHGTHGVPCRREAENANATACHSSSMFLMILMFLLKQTKAEDDPRHGSHRGWP